MTTIAASAASLTGLLFVALSVVRRPDRVQSSPPVIQQVRAAAALLAFFNALAISLFGLVPGTNIGYPALILAIGGLLFTAAALRSILSSRATMGLLRRQTGLIFILLLIFGAELVNGIRLLASPASTDPVEIISYALAASVLLGIARAWELVGDRDTGIFASIAVLAEHEHAPRAPHLAGAPAAGATDAPGGADAPRAPAGGDPPRAPAGGDPPRDGTDSHRPGAHDRHYPDAQDAEDRPG